MESVDAGLPAGFSMDGTEVGGSFFSKSATSFDALHRTRRFPSTDVGFFSDGLTGALMASVTGRE
jgi:hypothetical protein